MPIITKNTLVIWLSGCLLLAGCTDSPTGRKQFILVSGSQMASLGQQSYAELKRTEKINTNPAINQYVQCVTDRLLKVVPPQPDFKNWEVTVFDSPQVNAFALPGGKIGVYTGLLKVAQTEDQLAAVIGHEIGHVLANHSGERMSSSMAANGAMQLVNAALDVTETEHSDLIMAGLGLGVNVGVILPFSRTHESESDLIGLRLMQEAGFDPNQSVALWRNMAKASGNSTPEFLSTHPSPSTRIEDLQRAITSLPTQAAKGTACKRPKHF